VVGGQLVDTGKLIEIDHLQAADGDPSSLITSLLPTGHRRSSTTAASVGSYVASCPWKSRLVDRQAVIDKLVYTACNPVQDDLVDRAHHWPGVNGLTALLLGRPMRATRPLHFFRPHGPMPDAIELRLTIPPELGPEAEVLGELKARVQLVESEREAERHRMGIRVRGRRAVLTQSWRGQPTSFEPHRSLSPRVATQSKWARTEALLRNRVFVKSYTKARQQWSKGLSAIFPYGTYWLQRHANVTVVDAQDEQSADSYRKTISDGEAHQNRPASPCEARTGIPE